jgi:hypothetical protein
MSTVGWMDKQKVVYAYNGILFHYKKKEILPLKTTCRTWRTFC